MSEGAFVVFEGGDRVGKSTQVRALARALVASEVDHLITREPGDSQIGGVLRSLLLDPANDLDDRCEALLYAADKAQHLHDVVRPGLAAGRVVVCDRYVDSMLAYQGAGRAMAMTELRGLLDWATGGLRPDLTVLLDAEPGIAVEQASDKDRLELAGAEFHARVARGFRDLAAEDPDRYLVLPGLADIEETAAAIRERVSRLIGRPLLAPDLDDLLEES